MPSGTPPRHYLGVSTVLCRRSERACSGPPVARRCRTAPCPPSLTRPALSHPSLPPLCATHLSPRPLRRRTRNRARSAARRTAKVMARRRVGRRWVTADIAFTVSVSSSTCGSGIALAQAIGVCVHAATAIFTFCFVSSNTATGTSARCATARSGSFSCTTEKSWTRTA